MGKRGRLLGIRCSFGVLVVLFLSLWFWLLTVLFLWIGKILIGWLTDVLLRIDNVSQGWGHVLDQQVPMSCHFQGSPSI